MLIFREPTESDFPLIADSFWRGAIESCPGVGRAFLVSMLERVCKNPQWKVAILCDDSAPDEIMCWGIWRNKAEIFWVATSLRYQKLGLRLGEKMFDHIGIHGGLTVSCCIIPKALWMIAAKHRIKLIYRPYMALV